MFKLQSSKHILMLCVSVAVALLIAEGGLRLAGARPGVFTLSREFKIVDSLVLYQNFVTDKKGIYKFSSWVTDSFVTGIDCNTELARKSSIAAAVADIDAVDLVYIDFLQLANKTYCVKWPVKLKRLLFGNKEQSYFGKLYAHLARQNNRDVWQQTIVDYVKHPFNEAGFRSIPFRNDSTTHKKILVIGDSYVYGLNASPFHASFTDCLLAKGYMVYAAGIPGTDPAQYTAIAQEYIPVIHPDLVVMCFYEGNDYMLFDRQVSSERPLEYLTNAGFYQSAPYGKFMTKEECYEHYKGLITIPHTTGVSLNNVMRSTVISSLCWGLLFKLGMVQHAAVKESEQLLSTMFNNVDPEHTAKHIRNFNEACLQNKTPVIYTIIPQRDDFRFPNVPTVTPDTAKARKVFGRLPFYTPWYLERKVHYGSNDSHFNTEGSVAFAEYLDSLIRQHFNNIVSDSVNVEIQPVQ